MKNRPKVAPIPRIKISLSTRELLRFTFNLFTRISPRIGKDLIQNFETAFSARYNYPQGLAVCKARTSFFLILQALPLKKGSEVVISALHIADFVNMIRLAGYVPIVADLEKDSLSVDLQDLEQKITTRTQLVLVTHLAGYATDMNQILRITKPRGIFVIEDCSQAVTSSINNQKLGTFGDAAIFSLSLLKPICTIDGGFILSEDRALIETLRKQTNSWPSTSKVTLLMGAIKNLIIKLVTNPIIFTLFTRKVLSMRNVTFDLLSKFQKQNRTVSLRKTMPQFLLRSFCWQQAVLGLSQLATLENRERSKLRAANRLYSNINQTSRISLPKIASRTGNSFWLFPIFTVERFKLQCYLLAHGVDSSGLLLSCLAEEPVFSDLKFSSPNARIHKRNILFLPVYSCLSDTEVDRITHVINMY